MIRHGDRVRYRPDSKQARDFLIPSDAVGVVLDVGTWDAIVDFGPHGCVYGAKLGDLMADLNPQKPGDRLSARTER